MNPARIPFAAAISHPKLLGPRFKELSVVQQVILKAAYGLELDDSRRDEKGFTEQDYFAALSGFGEFDELGYLLRVDRAAAGPYVPQEYREVILNEGVRSGKSTIASFVVTYEATCGGHEARVRRGRRLICFQIAQDLNQAKYALNDIVANLDSMEWLQSGGEGGGKRYEATKERIDLWNGVTIMTVPPTVKSVRGYDSPAAVLDEVAVWYQDSDSANPDYEIYNQVRSRQAQFLDPKIWLISSPWNEGGLLFERVKAGTNGRHVRCDLHAESPEGADGCPNCASARRAHAGRLVLSMPTAAMGNPLVTRQWLQEYRNSSPRAFERECLARFQKSVSGFLEPEVVEGAVAKGVKERAPQKGPIYVAAMDPAFRRDIFAFAVCHTDDKGRVIFDRVERWRRAASGPPLDVSECLDKVAAICRAYGITTVASDQYQVESLKVLALQRGLSIHEVNFQATSKAEIYSNLRALLAQRKLVLLDRQDVVEELTRLEMTLTPGGVVQIQAPRGATDDLATVIALGAKQAIWLTPIGPAPSEEELLMAPYATAEAVPTLHERIQAQIAQRWAIAADDWD